MTELELLLEDEWDVDVVEEDVLLEPECEELDVVEPELEVEWLVVTLEVVVCELDVDPAGVESLPHPAAAAATTTKVRIPRLRMSMDLPGDLTSVAASI